MALLKNGMLMAIVAQGMLGLSLLWDKILLRKPATQNLVSYVFWMGAISIFGVILAFFGFKRPPVSMALLAFLRRGCAACRNLFLLPGAETRRSVRSPRGEGRLRPRSYGPDRLAAAGRAVGHHSLVAFALLVAGGFVMFLAERQDFHKLIGPVLLASSTYGLVNVTQKIAFNRTNLVTGYVFFTLDTFAGAMFLLIRPSWRRQIFGNIGDASPKHGEAASSRFWYFVNRFVNGLGSFLVYYAISLISPAEVDAIGAVRYVVIFVGAYAITMCRPRWLKEDFHGMVLAGKAAATLLVAAGLILESLTNGEAPGV